MEQFYDNLIHQTRKYAWDEHKNIKDLTNLDRKAIFLTTLFSFCKTHGTEAALKQKKSIIFCANKEGLSQVEVLNVIFTSVGKEAVEDFKNRIVINWTAVWSFFVGLFLGIICLFLR